MTNFSADPGELISTFHWTGCQTSLGWIEYESNHECEANRDAKDTDLCQT